MYNRQTWIPVDVCHLCPPSQPRWGSVGGWDGLGSGIDSVQRTFIVLERSEEPATRPLAAIRPVSDYHVVLLCTGPGTGLRYLPLFVVYSSTEPQFKESPVPVPQTWPAAGHSGSDPGAAHGSGCVSDVSGPNMFFGEARDTHDALGG